MTWWLLAVPFVALALLVIVEIAADWIMACKRVVAPWNDSPSQNKARTKVWFP